METLGNIFGQAAEDMALVSQLRQVDSVLQYLPQNTQFITVATGVLLDDPEKLNNIYVGTRNSSGVMKVIALQGQKSIGYLSHNGAYLSFITTTHIVFQFPVTQISQVVRYNKHDVLEGFVIALPTGSYAFGNISPVKKDDRTQYRTFEGASDVTSGWYKEFKNLGVVSPEQVKKEHKSNVIAFIIWAIIFVGGIVLIVVLHRK